MKAKQATAKHASSAAPEPDSSSSSSGVLKATAKQEELLLHSILKRRRSITEEEETGGECLNADDEPPKMPNQCNSNPKAGGKTKVKKVTKAVSVVKHVQQQKTSSSATNTSVAGKNNKKEASNNSSKTNNLSKNHHGQDLKRANPSSAAVVVGQSRTGHSTKSKFKQQIKINTSSPTSRNKEQNSGQGW